MRVVMLLVSVATKASAKQPRLDAVIPGIETARCPTVA